MEGKTVSVRKRKEGDLGSFAMETFLERVQKEIAERVIH
jgi:threonyl-tRNA synthetase